MRRIPHRRASDQACGFGAAALISVHAFAVKRGGAGREIRGIFPSWPSIVPAIHVLTTKVEDVDARA
jgi:hypothetical protein